ncbi:MAG TPA: hypothetical protein VMB21_19540 [Candidatus Limnocylindria bacterium]|jgi:hypothetical protein|nr:hypothetical protein [Candidatus Limnocylindria bacterium]
MKAQSRRQAYLFILVVAVMLVLLWRIASRGPTSQPADLSVTFLGLTNNPVAQFKPFRLCVPGSPTGTCALFQLKNVGRLRSIGFETLGVEQLTREGWRPFSPTGPWQGMNGSVWTPGSAALFAIGWPPGLASDATWRLTLRWRRELPVIKEVINQWSGRQLFRYDTNVTFLEHSSQVP